MSADSNAIVKGIFEELNNFSTADASILDRVNSSSTDELISNNGQFSTVGQPEFPNIYPPEITDFFLHQSTHYEYLSGATLAAISTCIGNSAVLEAMDGFIVKSIVYIAIVGSPGDGKSPALKKAFAPLEAHDALLYEEYLNKCKDFELEFSVSEKDKKQPKPKKPSFPQTLVKDSTIEMVVKILSHNQVGCCIVADELSGFMKRMNQYKAGDEEQKWLEMWSGAPILLQRITREENKVQEPFCSIVGGIQPGVLESLSKADNEHNGFYHRFLFVYPEPQHKLNWQKIEVPYSIKEGFNSVFRTLLRIRSDERTIYRLDSAADKSYEQWFNRQNERYNKAPNDQVKGIIAKYQEYCLRFALILQVLYDGSNRRGIVTNENLGRAIKLTEYFFANMNKAIKTLAPESPVDRLKPLHEQLYKALPEQFVSKVALAEGQKLGMKDSAIKMFLLRGVESKLFTLIKRGEYGKNC